MAGWGIVRLMAAQLRVQSPFTRAVSVSTANLHRVRDYILYIL